MSVRVSSWASEFGNCGSVIVVIDDSRVGSPPNQPVGLFGSGGTPYLGVSTDDRTCKQATGWPGFVGTPAWYLSAPQRGMEGPRGLESGEASLQSLDIAAAKAPTRRLGLCSNWRDVMPEPSKKEIEARAYQLWEKAGRPEGREDEFWHLAQQELRNEDKSSPSRTPDTL
jgi:DUF2934 family protein